LDVRQPQVMLEVLIVSLSDRQTLDLGVELVGNAELSSDTVATLASLFGLSTSGDDLLERGVEDPRGGTAVILNPGDFAVVVRALETINQGRNLNIPQVLVNNHEEARIEATLQQPFATINASDTVATTAFGGTFDAGTT